MKQTDKLAQEGFFTRDQLAKLRYAESLGFDITPFAKESISEMNMGIIIEALTDGLDITDMLDPALSFGGITKLYMKKCYAKNGATEDELLDFDKNFDKDWSLEVNKD